MGSDPDTERAPGSFAIMQQPFRKFWVLLIVVAMLALVAICLWSIPASHPKLSVSYIQTIDGHGHWRMQFGITNIGNCTVVTSKLGRIEMFNRTNLFSVGATSPLSKLVPGQGQVVDVVLSEAQMDSIEGRWRYTCLYAEDGLRPRISRWQWGSAGPGARVNWLIPRRLKGIPLTAKGTSDWIQAGRP